MDWLSNHWRKSPVLPRIVPLLAYLVLTGFQGKLGTNSQFWVYFLKTMAGAFLLWSVLPFVAEIKWQPTWEACVVGVGVFVLWVGLDSGLIALGMAHSYPKSVPELKLLLGWQASVVPADLPPPWNPHLAFGQDSPLAWLFILVRLLGSSLVVPPIEEVFYRSFLYRWLHQPDFQSASMGRFYPVSFLLTALIFASSHYQWLAAVLCAFAYQGLVCWKKRLGDAIVAHAITNFLLGLWVVFRPAWNFW